MLDDMIKVLQVIYFIVSIAWVVAQASKKTTSKITEELSKEASWSLASQ